MTKAAGAAAAAKAQAATAERALEEARTELRAERERNHLALAGLGEQLTRLLAAPAAGKAKATGKSAKAVRKPMTRTRRPRPRELL
ncbi:MAG: hypothetical protein M3314_03820 [Actinomycetota bacterium]|nr:hypothetical protein [Actinomycetota bacterium]